MKIKYQAKLLALATVAALLIPARLPAEEAVDNAIEMVREVYQVDRRQFVADRLQLSEKETAEFWDLYGRYRAEVDKLGDELVKIVLEYGDLYPKVPEPRAQQLLKRYLALDEKLIKKRAWYLKRAERVLPASKVLRWAQLENRMDMLLRLQLSGSIPLMPARK